MKEESKTKINHEKNDDYKIKTSVMSDRSDTIPNNHSSYYSFECYYCDKLPSTTNEDEYRKHVVIYHNNKPAYPSMADLIKNNLKPQGKSWEV